MKIGIEAIRDEGLAIIARDHAAGRAKIEAVRLEAIASIYRPTVKDIARAFSPAAPPLHRRRIIWPFGRSGR